MSKKETKKVKPTPDNVYLHNVTDKVVVVDGREIEPGDAISVSPKIVKEAKEAGLE